jgi:biotin-(acetyl-CoA carboxylase) ligase
MAKSLEEFSVKAAVGGVRSIVIGIGLNCSGSPQGLDQPVTDLTQALGVPTNADQIRLPIVEEVIAEIDKLESEGPSSIQKRYAGCAVFSSGTKVEWGNPLQWGYVRGLGPRGELQVLRESGEVHSLFAEDVKVRKKFE